eukprot:6424557-Pyramimonas_sp.AAC.1
MQNGVDVHTPTRIEKENDRKGEGKVVESTILVFANNAVANTFVLGGVTSGFGVDHPCKKYT